MRPLDPAGFTTRSDRADTWEGVAMLRDAFHDRAVLATLIEEADPEWLDG